MPTAILDENNIAISEGTITVYNYDYDTNELIGSGEEYLAVGVGIPGHSTIIAPPEIQVGNAIVWTGSSWEYKEDHRGEIVYDASGNEVLIRELGPYPEGTTTTKPEKTSIELYNKELALLASTYNNDMSVLADGYSKAGLTDGTNEATKKTALYNEYLARKAQYQSDISNLKTKYGV